MSYNHSIDLHAMQATAKADLVAARLLWNLGLMAQSIWLLQQSVEKYLKCLWATNRTFKDQKDLQKHLKNIGHDIKGLFEALNLSDRKRIKSPMWVVSLDAIRYNATFGYSYDRFRSGEKFINEIRKLLKEPIRKNHLDEWKKTTMRMSGNYKTEAKALHAVKLILSLTNPETKRERKEHKKRWAEIMAGLDK